MKRAYADIPEGQMHYRHAGEGGEAVILLHMSGSSSEEYERVGDLLSARGFRVYAPDLLGFGASDKPARFYYSFDEHISSLLAFMDALGISAAYFYGNMATANLIARLGVLHAERVRGLMLAHPLYNPDPEYYIRRGHNPAFCKIDPSADGSHMAALWARADKYGAEPVVTDRRCADLHKAGEWGETLHWALHEDTPFGEYLDRLRVRTVIVPYGFFGDPALLRQAAERLADGAFDLYRDATPYLSRIAPQAVAEMFCRYFPLGH